MQQDQHKTSRKKILLWGAAVLASFTTLKFFSVKKTEEEDASNETVKMLTQDGKLVEIDKRLLAASGKKISNDELQKWIKK